MIIYDYVWLCMIIYDYIMFYAQKMMIIVIHIMIIISIITCLIVMLIIMIVITLLSVLQQVRLAIYIDRTSSQALCQTGDSKPQADVRQDM